MSSKICRRHTRRQKKMKGSGWFFSDPPPRVVNYETGAFQFYDPMTRSSKVYDPTLCGVRNLNPMTDNLNLPVNPQIPAPILYRVPSQIGDFIYIEFFHPMTGNTRKFNVKTGITEEVNDNYFEKKYRYQPVCSANNPIGGKLTKRIMKRSKTRKTRRNKK
jgi:hypothetical protein